MKSNNTNKKLAILILVLILIFPSIAYAKPFTEAFKGGLIEINNFFEQENYKPYSKTIDFVFFSLLFISIYMIGVRYAFKEVKRPETLIAVLLGLMSAFLLVLGGFSATILLPYIPWLLYVLLFILYWWLLKGIKNKFWRFMLALLLTLLTIALVQGLFNSLTAPQVGTSFFKDFGASFKGIEFPGISQPGMPSYLQDLFEKPSSTTTTTTEPGTGTTTTPKTEPAKPGTAEEKGFFGKNWWWIMILLILLIYLGRNKIPWPKRKPKEPPQTAQAEPTIQDILKEIDDVIKEKEQLKGEINRANKGKHQIIQAAEKKTAIIVELKDPAFVWERIKQFEEGHPLKEFDKKEFELATQFKLLNNLEKKLLEALEKWQQDLKNKIDITQEINDLKVLIGRKTSIGDIKNMGIIWMIVVCYDWEKRESILNKNLKELLDEGYIEKALVKGKYEIWRNAVKKDEKLLDHYNDIENWIIIKFLIPKIELQIDKLKALKNKLSEPVPAQLAYGPYSGPYGPSPYKAPYGTPPYGIPPYGVPSKIVKAGKIRVLMVSSTTPKMSNGVSQVVDNLSKELRSLGVEVDVLIKWFGEPYLLVSENSSSSKFDTVEEFLNLFKPGYYDFIHAHTFTVAQPWQVNQITDWEKILEHFKTPSAFTVHSLDKHEAIASKWIKLAYNYHMWVGDDLQPKMFDTVNVIIQLTKTFTKLTEEMYPGKNYSFKTVIIPNGVDLKNVNPRAKPKSKDINLLYIGRFERRKGMYELCIAFAQLLKKYPKLKLHIAGEGTPRVPKEIAKYEDFEAGAMKKIFRSLKVSSDRYKFYGNVVGESKEQVFEIADLVIVPSYFETFALVGLEAIARKRPLIVADVPALKEIYVDTGLACPILIGELKYNIGKTTKEYVKFRVDRIIEAVDYCIKNIDECDKRAEKAFEFLQQNAHIFDWVEIAKKTKEVYESLIKTNRVPNIEIIVPKFMPPITILPSVKISPLPEESQRPVVQEVSIEIKTPNPKSPPGERTIQDTKRQIGGERMEKPTEEGSIATIKTLESRQEFSQNDILEIGVDMRLEVPPKGFKYMCMARNSENIKDMKRLETDSDTITSQSFKIKAYLKNLTSDRYFIAILLVDVFPKKPVKERHVMSNYVEIKIE